MEILIEIYISLTFAAWGFLLSQVLTDSRHFLSWLPNFGNRLASLGKYGAGIKWEKNILQQAIVNWFGGCGVCIAGISAVLLYPLWFQSVWDFNWTELWRVYPFIVHLSVIILSMFLAEVFDRKLS